MTQDELIMACATTHRELADSRKTVSKCESLILDFDNQIARQELLYRTTREALESLVKSSVILLAEYKSLQSGIVMPGKKLAELKDLRRKTVVTMNKALAAIPGLKRSLQQLEHSLDTYEPPRTVLEFRRDK